MLHHLLPVKFESMWVDDEDCAKVIEDSWQQPAQGSFSHQLVQRLQLCQRKLIQWSKGAFQTIEFCFPLLRSQLILNLTVCLCND